MNYFQRLQISIDFIENNLAEDITLAEVASKANCSLYHFHRLFQVLVGNSVPERYSVFAQVPAKAGAVTRIFQWPRNVGAGFGYLICSEVENLDDIPDGFVSRTIPRAKYAVFTIEGGFPKIQKGMESIYKNWLSNTSYELADSPNFEKYDEHWTENNDSKMP